MERWPPKKDVPWEKEHGPGQGAGLGDIEHDFARHVGAVYPRRAYRLTRERVEEAHGKSFRSFVSASTVTVPDYNLLAGFCARTNTIDTRKLRARF